MKALIKVVVAVILLVLAGFCLSRFRGSYVNAEVKRGELSEPATEPTNALADNMATNFASATNALAASTNTADASGSNAPAVASVKSSLTSAAPVVARDAGSRSMGWLAGFIGSLLLFGGVVAWEAASWFANRAHSSMFATDAAPESSPEYDAAEQVAMNGDFLGAIELMREYLKKNPREQYVAIRIAEIYEKDLNNYLAAAMELEEVLNKKISREKWGWTAIHLANIYSGRLNRPEKAFEVLRHIVKEAPETAAAKKARERVGTGDAPDGTVAAAERSAAAEPEQDPNMPKGFAPKKR